MKDEILQIKKEKILEIHGRLSRAKNLKPSARNDALFSELVEIVKNTPAEQSALILGSKRIRSIMDDLRSISSRAESELELFWVKKALKSTDAGETIRNFPYHANYEKMTDLEIETLRLCDIHKNHKALFVGSGPLPLSSIMMAQKYGICVDGLDMDEQAIDLSKKLIERIGLSDKISAIKGNVLDMQDFSKYQTIFIAALAGDNENEKTEIINHLVSKCAKDTHIVMRSVTDLGTLLYSEITPTQLKDVEVIRRSKGTRDFINNIIIGKKK